MSAVEESARSNTEFAKSMRIWAVWLLVLGLLGTIGLTELFTDLGLQYQELWLLLGLISRVATLFALPLSAALFVGAMIVRRLPDRNGGLPDR